jgi:hypothetical protein
VIVHDSGHERQHEDFEQGHEILGRIEKQRPFKYLAELVQYDVIDYWSKQHDETA